MAKGIRFTETWFNRGLWAIALMFAAFLIGLGSLVVGDLPRVEQTITTDQFIDQTKARPIDGQIKTIDSQIEALNRAIDPIQKQVDTATNNTQSEQDSFDNWIKTRQATGKSDQDPEVIARTRKLESLRSGQSDEQQKLDAINQKIAELTAQKSKLQDQRDELETAAQSQVTAAENSQELRVFGYRLLITLPLLLLAGWLFLRRRKNRYWPFVWGFIFFALYAFFVELVPYLPDYGGYVRYIVGIVVTIFVGRYAINALQAYLERQKHEESKPDVERREELNYDLALSRMNKKVCPGCERPFNYESEERNFCTHCGICVFNHCDQCKTRKNAFAKFCHACGFGVGKAEIAN